MTTLSTCLSAFGLFNDDKLNGDDPISLNQDNDFNLCSSKFLPDDLTMAVDPLRSDASPLTDDPLNMLQDIDHIFSSTSNYSGSLDGGLNGDRSTRTSISSDHCPTHFPTDITDIDLDMIQEVLEKEVQSQVLDSSSDIELESNEVTVSEEIEEEDVPFFDTRELHNYSRTDCGHSAGESSPSGGSSTKEDIEPDDDDDDRDMDDYESEDSKDSDDDDVKVPQVLTTKSNRGLNGRRKNQGIKNGQTGLNKYQISNGQKLTRRSITDRNLTEEEKRLLAKEGYTNFPKPGTPLTKQEEKVLRKVRRKIRNKKSAQCSRQRKKEYVEELEKKFEDCNSENSLLKKEVLKLKRENSNLLVKMKNLISGKITPTTGTALVPNGHSNGVPPNSGSTNSTSTNSSSRSFKTSFFVLFLSFFLVLLPFFNPDSIEDQSLLLNTESLESLYKEPNALVGRHLMAYNSSPNTQENNSKYNFYSVPNSLFVPRISDEKRSRVSSAINSSSVSSGNKFGCGTGSHGHGKCTFDRSAKCFVWC